MPADPAAPRWCDRVHNSSAAASETAGQADLNQVRAAVRALLNLK